MMSAGFLGRLKKRCLSLVSLLAWSKSFSSRDDSIESAALSEIISRMALATVELPETVANAKTANFIVGSLTTA